MNRNFQRTEVFTQNVAIQGRVLSLSVSNPYLGRHVLTVTQVQFHRLLLS